MSQDLQSFIDAARTKDLSDEQIKERLTAAGWDRIVVDSALDGLVVPLPPSSAQKVVEELPSGTETKPVTIVQNQSTRGLEYNIMFLALAFTAFGFAGLLHDFVDTATGTSVYPHIGGMFAITSLIVLGPIFTVLFFRLKEAETKSPALRKDPFRRRWIQFTLLVTFFIGVLHLLYFVYKILSPSRNTVDYYGRSVGGGSETFVLLLHVIVTLLVAGGIFAYYWVDEHRTPALHKDSDEKTNSKI